MVFVFTSKAFENGLWFGADVQSHNYRLCSIAMSAYKQRYRRYKCAMVMWVNTLVKLIFDSTFVSQRFTQQLFFLRNMSKRKVKPWAGLRATFIHSMVPILLRVALHNKQRAMFKTYFVGFFGVYIFKRKTPCLP